MDLNERIKEIRERLDEVRHQAMSAPDEVVELSLIIGVLITAFEENTFECE